jgi:hypothetical protein
MTFWERLACRFGHKDRYFMLHLWRCTRCGRIIEGRIPHPGEVDPRREPNKTFTPAIYHDFRRH